MSEFEGVGNQAGSRFQLVNAVPATMLVLFTFGLLFSGAWSGAPSIGSLRQGLGSLGIREVAGLTFLVFVVSLITNSFQTRLVKTLEGYWTPSGPRLMLLARGLDRHHFRRDRLGVLRADDARLPLWQRAWLRSVPRHRRTEMQTRVHEWLGQRHDRYPAEPARVLSTTTQLVLPLSDFELAESECDVDRLMPTELGNVLRRVEDHAGDRYGLDAVELASRLLAVASADTVATYEDARTELDVTAKLVLMWWLCTLAGLVLLIDDGPWLLLPLLTYAMAWLAYRAAIIAAEGFGSILIELVDLNRFSLLEAMHWPLPDKVGDEAANAAPLWRLLAGTNLPEDDLRAFRHPSAKANNDKRSHS